MNEENTKKLFDKYPKIFAQKDLPIQQTLMCCGFSCGDGWYDLIDTLCNEIQEHVSYSNDQAERFKDCPEYDGNREPLKVEAVQVKEKWGGLRFYVIGANDYIRGLISFAENMSYKICEVCGKPGRPNSKGWISTLCEEHREELSQSRIARMQESLQLKIPFEEGSP